MTNDNIFFLLQVIHFTLLRKAETVSFLDK